MVVAQTTDYFVLNKPAGLSTQGGSGPHARRNLDRMLAGLVEPGQEPPRLVHRLDRLTSGRALLPCLPVTSAPS